MLKLSVTDNEVETRLTSGMYDIFAEQKNISGEFHVIASMLAVLLLLSAEKWISEVTLSIYRSNCIVNTNLPATSRRP